ncbi:MAG: beta-lactamase family protein, partial [Colwellia sp.]|nr:beta-lactamase family protein [Colwellia sp.]
MKDLLLLKSMCLLAIIILLSSGFVVFAKETSKADGLIDPGISITAAERLIAKSPRQAVKAKPYSIPVKLNDGLSVGDLSQQFTSTASITELASKISQGEFNHIDSLLISKNGQLVFEQYWQQAAQDKPHFVASITKNMISNAIGKAIELGMIASVNDPIIRYFPEFDQSRLAQGVETITISHLLSMRSGLRFTDNKMEANYLMTDHVQYFLSQSQPVSNNKQFKYQHSDPEILAHLIHKVSGQQPEQFLLEHYFKPLGISNFTWQKSSCGIS